jgi:hypothetical protein
MPMPTSLAALRMGEGAGQDFLAPRRALLAAQDFSDLEDPTSGIPASVGFEHLRDDAQGQASAIGNSSWEEFFGDLAKNEAIANAEGRRFVVGGGRGLPTDRPSLNALHNLY